MGPDADHARTHLTIAVPGATAQSLGVPDKPNPTGIWIMNAGTTDHHIDDAGALDGVKPLIFGLLAIPALAWAQGKQTFTGVVTDSMCADGDHSHMKMGPTDAECTIACVSIHDAMLVCTTTRKPTR